MTDNEKIDKLILGVRVLRVLIAWEAGELSEGQAMAALGVSRVVARGLKQQAVADGVKVHTEIAAAMKQKSAGGASE